MSDPPSSDGTIARLTGAQKGLFILLAISLTALLGCLFGAGLVFLAFPVGWLSALIATILGTTQLRNYRNPIVFYGLLFAVILFAVQTKIAPQIERLWLHGMDGASLSAANLRGIHVGLKEYMTQHKDYPASFSELVRSELASQKLFIAVFDPGLDWSFDVDEPRVAYSSFVYLPGKGHWIADPKIILAYEYDAWNPIKLQLFATCGQLVLFSDGRVELLEGMAFTKALRDDALRRHELGWPIDKVRPFGETISTKPATTQAASAMSP
jgi:hypothetical protein